MKLVKELLKAERNGYLISKIKAGRYLLSVQGGDGMYSTPRRIVNPDMYVDMELAIFTAKEEWFDVGKSKKLKAFPRWEELKQRADGPLGSCTVFGYVPMDLLNDFYLYLKS